MRRENVEPMSERSIMAPDFDYRHSTGPVIGRFLAGLKEQKKIWGRRAAGLCKPSGNHKPLRTQRLHATDTVRLS